MLKKLSVWCRDQNIHYNTGYKWFHENKIPNSFQNDYGSIFVNESPIIEQNKKENNVIYCRVSNNSRKEELNYQIKRCEDFSAANGIIIHKIFKEVASGMNDNRNIFWKMISDEPTTIIVENKDRLTRFGFNYIERLIAHKCKIIVINETASDKDDLLQDLVSIVTSFCCRIYGLRRAANKNKRIKEIINEDN